MISRDPTIFEAVDENTRIEEVAVPPNHRLSNETYRRAKELEELKKELTVPGCENDHRLDELQKQIEELWVGEYSTTR